ncbi:MAG: hypothetical protein RLY95_1134 [Pseudomonadota bacterium]|jgi:hypothetical protein
MTKTKKIKVLPEVAQLAVPLESELTKISEVVKTEELTEAKPEKLNSALSLDELQALINRVFHNGYFCEPLPQTKLISILDVLRRVQQGVCPNPLEYKGLACIGGKNIRINNVKSTNESKSETDPKTPIEADLPPTFALPLALVEEDYRLLNEILPKLPLLKGNMSAADFDLFLEKYRQVEGCPDWEPYLDKSDVNLAHQADVMERYRAQLNQQIELGQLNAFDSGHVVLLKIELDRPCYLTEMDARAYLNERNIFENTCNEGEFAKSDQLLPPGKQLKKRKSKVDAVDPYIEQAMSAIEKDGGDKFTLAKVWEALIELIIENGTTGLTLNSSRKATDSESTSTSNEIHYETLGGVKKILTKANLAKRLKKRKVANSRIQPTSESP